MSNSRKATAYSIFVMALLVTTVAAHLQRSEDSRFISSGYLISYLVAIGACEIPDSESCLSLR